MDKPQEIKITSFEDVETYLITLDNRLVLVEAFQSDHDSRINSRIDRVEEVERKVDQHVDTILIAYADQEKKRGQFEVKIMGHLGTISNVVVQNSKSTLQTKYLVAGVLMLVFLLIGVVSVIGAKL